MMWCSPSAFLTLVMFGVTLVIKPKLVFLQAHNTWSYDRFKWYLRDWQRGKKKVVQLYQTAVCRQCLSKTDVYTLHWCLYLTTIPSLFLCTGISGSVLCLCPKLDQVLLKGSGFSPSQSASGTKKFFLGPVFLKCASNLCSILMEAYSTGVWGIYNHFISTCWHKTSCTHTHTDSERVRWWQ